MDHDQSIAICLVHVYACVLQFWLHTLQGWGKFGGVSKSLVQHLSCMYVCFLSHEKIMVDSAKNMDSESSITILIGLSSAKILNFEIYSRV
jgi:hypothetical protein